MDEDYAPTETGYYIAEIHPAVALWLWGADADEAISSWGYKKDPAVLTQLWEVLEHQLLSIGLLNTDHGFKPTNDDELDAFVAWALGALWTEGHKSVTLLGNRSTGSFLVLMNREINLRERFAEFVGKLPDVSMYDSIVF